MLPCGDLAGKIAPALRGYLIVKRSGSAGAPKGCSEIWFRWTLTDAMQKYHGIVKQKKAIKKGRVYFEVEAGLF